MSAVVTVLVAVVEVFLVGARPLVFPRGPLAFWTSFLPRVTTTVLVPFTVPIPGMTTVLSLVFAVVAVVPVFPVVLLFPVFEVVFHWRIGFAEGLFAILFVWNINVLARFSPLLGRIFTKQIKGLIYIGGSKIYNRIFNLNVLELLRLTDDQI